MFDVKTYSDDLPLFKELGLKPFHLKTWEEAEVGIVSLEDGSTITLRVVGYPAQFWTAEIESVATGDRLVVATGSGSFSKYWPMFKSLADNMLVVKSFVPGHQYKEIPS